MSMSSGSSANNHHHHHPPSGGHKAAAWREVLPKVKNKVARYEVGDRYSALRLALTRAVCVGESNVLATSRAHVSAISSEDNWESQQ